MGSVAIVVPVYNGAAEVERCLAALARHRPRDSTIVLVDDASPEPAIRPMLEAFAASHPDVRVLAVTANGGYVKAANLGAANAPAGADLLFLNADTEVTDGWYDAMADAITRIEGAAVCCPLSNNASYLSVPKFNQSNDLPPGLDAEQMAALVRRCAGEVVAVAAPTPVGFCMLVRRAAWERFGPFDEAFGRGYGEEDDFGQRVQAAGGTIVCATRAFVYHRGGASFATAPATREERRANGERLASRWPMYGDRMRAWCRANPLRPLHERIWSALLRPAHPAAIQVLHAVERWELAGPLRDNLLQLVRATADFALHTIVVPTPDRGAWMDAIDFEFGPGVRVTGLIDFERHFERFLAASPAAVVHFHAPQGWVSPALLEAARRQRTVLATNEAIVEVARCAELYRRVADAPAASGGAAEESLTRPYLSSNRTMSSSPR